MQKASFMKNKSSNLEIFQIISEECSSLHQRHLSIKSHFDFLPICKSLILFQCYWWFWFENLSDHFMIPFFYSMWPSLNRDNSGMQNIFTTLFSRKHDSKQHLPKEFLTHLSRGSCWRCVKRRFFFLFALLSKKIWKISQQQGDKNSV